MCWKEATPNSCVPSPTSFAALFLSRRLWSKWLERAGRRAEDSHGALVVLAVAALRPMSWEIDREWPSGASPLQLGIHMLAFRVLFHGGPSHVGIKGQREGPWMVGFRGAESGLEKQQIMYLHSTGRAACVR